MQPFFVNLFSQNLSDRFSFGFAYREKPDWLKHRVSKTKRYPHQKINSGLKDSSHVNFVFDVKNTWTTSIVLTVY